MARTYKSPIDGKIFKTIPELENYTRKYHMDKIPKEYKGDVSHFLFDARNGKGKCQICGASPTKWDPKKKQYDILCEPISIQSILKDPFRVLKTFIKNRGNSCKDVMRKRYVENIKRTWNTDNLMANPDYSKMLMENRRIAHQVEFKGKKFTVLGTYEVKFMEVLKICVFGSDDVEAPGPEIKWTDWNGNVKTHIPDFYIRSINCIVSIKDGGENKNNHPSMLERRKADAYKFKALVDKTKYNVVELNGIKEIEGFPQMYRDIKKSSQRYIKYPEYYKDYIKE